MHLIFIPSSMIFLYSCPRDNGHVLIYIYMFVCMLGLGIASVRISRYVSQYHLQIRYILQLYRDSCSMMSPLFYVKFSLQGELHKYMHCWSPLDAYCVNAIWLVHFLKSPCLLTSDTTVRFYKKYR